MEIKHILEDKKLKNTVARTSLLEIFATAVKPLSFEDIKEKISMDKATFYRNMLTFENEAIIHGFESHDKKRYYELQKSPHAHFICNVCYKVECLKDVKPVRLKGYKISDMIFKGICKNCH